MPMPGTTDIAELCRTQDEWCSQMQAAADARRAATPHAPSYSEQERAEHLSRTARELAQADVRLERAVTAKRRADYELDLAKRSRLLAYDRYERAVSRCAAAPDTTAPEKETPRP